MRIFKFRDVVPQLFNLLVKRRFRFRFEMIPHEVKDILPKKITNFFLAGLNQFVLPSRPIGRPVIAQVEPANFCNLSCPLCLTASQTASRPKALLPFETFKRFIDETGDYLLLIVLWNWGEPFLNPDIFRIISYAKARNIVVHSSTNGNVLFDEEKAARLVGSGLDSLVVAVDGATQETYEQYRKGGNLNRVIENMRTIIRVRDEMGSATPRLNMRFVVMKHNEAHLPRIKRLAEELGVDFLTLKTVDMHPDCGTELDGAYAPESGEYRRYEYEESYRRKRRPFTCMRPWKRITLDALGDVIPCEYDYKGIHSFGNSGAGKSALAAWKSEVSAEFRKGFNLGNNGYYLCLKCTYKDRVADDCVVEKVALGRKAPS